MHWVDYAIVIVPVLIVIGMAIYSSRYARDAVDFLAAGRVAGRYVISVSDLSAALSVCLLIGGVESSYQTGYGIVFWRNILTPVGIVMALTGFCTYRWRQTRCLSKGQFIEMRYGSKALRIITAMISTTSEMLGNAIGPAVAANFYIYYLGLPHRVMICGINLPCFLIVVVVCLLLAMCIIWPAGRISLLISDCLQGLIAYPAFVIIAGFVLLKFSWNVDILPLLWDRPPGQSFINPYDVAQLQDFNVFALVVNLCSNILNRASWFGSDTTNSGKTPHEQKMAGILGSFRGGFSAILFMLLGIVIIVFMNNGRFAVTGENNPFPVNNNEIRKELSRQVLTRVVEDPVLRDKAIARTNGLAPLIHRTGTDAPLSQQNNLDTVYFTEIRDALGDTPEGRYAFQQYRTLFQQQMMPVVLKRIFPAGMVGLFCLLVVMLMISTDDSQIFNAAGCLTQDIILPCCKKQLSPKAHKRILRLTAAGVALFFLTVAMLFTQIDYINMLLTMTNALWMGGAGPIMVFGLYTRFGNLTGACCALIFGSGSSLLGILLQRNWAQTIYPYIDAMGWSETLNRMLIQASAPFHPWIQWQLDPVKFPLNSFEIFFISMVLAVSGYVIGSLLTYKPYDLDRLLHRGQYADEPAAPAPKRTFRHLWGKIIGITEEYTTGDKVIAWSLFGYSVVYQFLLSFAAVAIWNILSPWPKDWWSIYFLLVMIVIPGLLALISTVWFFIGGVIDMRSLFRDLKTRQGTPSDNGQVNLPVQEK